MSKRTSGKAKLNNLTDSKRRRRTGFGVRLTNEAKIPSSLTKLSEYPDVTIDSNFTYGCVVFKSSDDEECQISKELIQRNSYVYAILKNSFDTKIIETEFKKSTLQCIKNMIIFKNYFGCFYSNLTYEDVFLNLNEIIRFINKYDCIMLYIYFKKMLLFLDTNSKYDIPIKTLETCNLYNYMVMKDIVYKHIKSSYKLFEYYYGNNLYDELKLKIFSLTSSNELIINLNDVSKPNCLADLVADREFKFTFVKE
jgi:hypothetical protein